MGPESEFVHSSAGQVVLNTEALIWILVAALILAYVVGRLHGMLREQRRKTTKAFGHGMEAAWNAARKAVMPKRNERPHRGKQYGSAAAQRLAVGTVQIPGLRAVPDLEGPTVPNIHSRAS